MYKEFTIEQVVDELKKVRDAKKVLDSQEKKLKERILADGRTEIKGLESTMKLNIRNTETFNEEAFITAFKASSQFEDAIKNTIIRTKEIIDQEALNNAVKDDIIPLDYVIPFNAVKESKVITVK